ncbi:hypothetical protein L3Q82_022600 [Scortum barcoo]|uniref:Uncharacterized protein n=1 Tax=Scortum barcoo TaxID=214431 RepID=A0ACB8X1B1_9TELE|nr:hypothetical protein L3Q82_022600 [Scortum barcoo]
MRISTSKSEVRDSRFPLWFGEEVLPQVEEFKYLRILFTSKGKCKKELSRKAKLSIYQVNLRFPPSPMVMNFGVAGRSLRDRVRSSVTREELGVEPLLLHIERSQLRWLGHLFRMPPGRLPREVLPGMSHREEAQGRPRTRWRDYVSRLAWERLGVPPEELEEVSGAGLL